MDHRNDDPRAIELASAHAAGSVALEEATSIKLTHDADEALISRAAAGKWTAAAQAGYATDLRKLGEQSSR